MSHLRDLAEIYSWCALAMFAVVCWMDRRGKLYGRATTLQLTFVAAIWPIALMALVWRLGEWPEARNRRWP